MVYVGAPYATNSSHDITKDGQLQLYPNPAAHQIMVKADSKLIGKHYTLYDKLGRVVLRGTIAASNFYLEVAQACNGDYMFKVEGNATETITIINK